MKFTPIEWMAFVFVLTLFIIAFVIGPYNESKVYNRLTGAETTWWDAIWVQLRVQEPLKK